MGLSPGAKKLSKPKNSFRPWGSIIMKWFLQVVAFFIVNRLGQRERYSVSNLREEAVLFRGWVI